MRCYVGRSVSHRAILIENADSLALERTLAESGLFINSQIERLSKYTYKNTDIITCASLAECPESNLSFI